MKFTWIAGKVEYVYTRVSLSAGSDNETPPSTIRYQAGLNLSKRAQKRPDNELHTKQQFGPITRPKFFALHIMF